ncbi:MinD/ParA family protein [Oceanibacterium hippocampi]|uniref:Flagellum site-determining protein YlxH n=1 Tax=Oceanibacterium hippocampi TaxID=745714 RepID=A0A1Y5TQC9_9PROT|nr:MinD/ParA family protein [Oceanibacterium hippocampi]SLN69623.1 Flagellum site-determining protein YlxH [Oceanibacterium hippocampi]
MTLPESSRPARPLHHPASRTAGRNIVTIASGKGGVGKTVLAISLTHAIAREGRRSLLFDGDLGLANVDVQLGLVPEHDLGAVVAGRLRLADAVTRFPEGGFDILAGRSGSGSLAALGRAELQALREDLFALAAGYDAIVLDLGAGIDQPVRALTVPSGPKLVIATEEPTSLTDAYAFIKVTAAQIPGADIRIVVNMATSKAEAQRTYEKLRRACENFLKLSPPLAGIVHRDDKVRDAIRHQTAIFIRHPNSRVASDIEALAQSLCRELESGGSPGG